MEWLLEEARASGNSWIFLEVRPSNRPALLLYQSLGFAEVGIRRGYYQAVGGREDALVHRLDLDAWAMAKMVDRRRAGMPAD
jgi:ribosomal-protein-alanine N-acetyltransferase